LLLKPRDDAATAMTGNVSQHLGHDKLPFKPFKQRGEFRLMSPSAR